MIRHRPFDAEDAWLFGQGTHTRLWEVLGAHVGTDGTTFRVWAPDAAEVSVIGEANGWTHEADLLEPDPSGVWRGTVRGFEPGHRYKYHIRSHHRGYRVDKADPVGFAHEEPPRTASIVWNGHHEWNDGAWMTGRDQRQRHDQPMSIYEVHLGSWRYEPGGYEALGHQLADYCTDLGFTHVELLPITEHPFYGSWGYQTTGYFAPTARYGRPEDLRQLIDTLHQAGVGVLLDWVPSHFPTDEHSLGWFDGSHLYEHADPRLGYHPDWHSFVFNYDRAEVRSFLLSSAHFWLEEYHLDGLRVDAVASMLYLDYSRRDGEWIPNQYGGKENLGAINFLQELNRTVGQSHPEVLVIAEESTAWPGVTRSTDHGGLGFDFKWDMGWMHDTLRYLARSPVHRRHHHDEVTFRALYATTEQYVLPLSHDEVVHGKRSLLGKMPGDRWQQFANLRLLLGYQWTTPGKPLLFMGGEFGQRAEWDHESELSWKLLGDPAHAGVQGWVRHLNAVMAAEPALSRGDTEATGFQWVVVDDFDQSVLAWLRHDPTGRARPLLVVANFTPVVRHGYRIGVPYPGLWVELANSDDLGWGGSGVIVGPLGSTAGHGASHGQPSSLAVDLPPLALVILAPGS